MNVYFAQAVDGGPVKIGCSSNVPVRLKQLETQYGTPLALLAVMPGGRQEEREIHERFGFFRLGQTEQFQPVQEIMDFIGRPLLVGANPEAVEVMSSKRRVIVCQMRGSLEYKHWIEQAAELRRTTVSGLLDQAIAEYAIHIGFEERPPKR